MAWNEITVKIPFPDIGSDNLETCFDIMDAYIVLCSSDPDQFIKVCRTAIVVTWLE